MDPLETFGCGAGTRLPHCLGSGVPSLLLFPLISVSLFRSPSFILFNVFMGA